MMKKQLIAVLSFVLTWAASTALCYCVGAKWQPWIELVNGATWPSEPKTLASNWLLASALIGFRTTINFGIVVTLVAALFWLVFGGNAKFMDLPVRKRIRHRENALFGHVGAYLHTHLPPGSTTPAFMADMQRDVREKMRKQWTSYD